MKLVNSFPLLLEKYAEPSKRIYTRSDLAHLLQTTHASTLAKRLESLVQNGHLHRAINGIYFLEGAQLKDLAQRIFHDGYLSLHGVLSHHGLCGSFKSNRVDIITTRSRPKVIQSSLGTIHMHVQKALYHREFDFENGLHIATPEKCFVDTCYFHQRSPIRHINLYRDLALGSLSISKVEELLTLYKNKKFTQFVLGLMQSYGL